MYCPNCNTENKDDALFCANCGASLTGENRSYYQNEPQYEPQQYPEQSFVPDKYQGFPMKWYKFLIYFALFAGAVLNFLNGIAVVTGASYGDVKDMVYQYYPTLRPLDICVGVLMIALAAFGIFTRFQLAGLKKNAPMFLYLTYGAGCVISLIYLVATSVVLGESTLDASSIGSLLGSVAAIIINVVYFNKRKVLFVN